MKKLFNKIKDSFAGESDNDEITLGEEEYIELDTSASEEGNPKVVVRPFLMEDFSDIKTILDSLRIGNTIALINIKPLKEKDLIELKRAVAKLKKTCTAIDGDLRGFGDDYIVAVPNFAVIKSSKLETKTFSDDISEDFDQ